MAEYLINSRQKTNPFTYEAHYDIHENHDGSPYHQLNVTAVTLLRYISKTETLTSVEEESHTRGKYANLLLMPSKQNYDKIFTKILQKQAVHPPRKPTNMYYALLHDSDQLDMEMFYDRDTGMVSLLFKTEADTLKKLSAALKLAGKTLDNFAMCVATNSLIDDIKTGIYHAHQQYLREHEKAHQP